MGGLNHLANLRRLGFRTFNNFWDEGYDEYGMQHRVHEIDKLVDDISEWPMEKLITSLNDMQEILDHNFNTFMALTHNKIERVFND